MKSEPTMLPEAPASATAKMTSPNGLEWLITLRDLSASGLLNKINQLETKLLTDGWQPVTNGPSPASAPADAGGPPVCPYHGPMKRSKKFEGWYCPQKMGDGSYCKEQVKD
ncbi:MAG: hypothetical protein KDI79_06115 [Anaerolineae bacterium]|nr:hypothetical protein [Anaerolineae bacterium]